MSLHALLAGHAERHPERPCLLGPEPLSWAAFYRRVMGYAAYFAAYRGRVVAIALPEGPELATLLVGCLLSGAIALPMAASATAHERERILAGLEPALLLDTTPPLGANPRPIHAPAAEDIALLVGTSGSTGEPKRVALTYAGIAWNAQAHAASLELPEGVRTLVTSPLHHAFPFIAVVLGTLLRGGSLAWLSGTFTPRGLLKQAAAQGIQYVALTPTLMRLLLERCAAGTPLPEVLSIGAAPIMPNELQAACVWAQAGGARLYHTYGLSEAGPRVSTLDPEGIALQPASVGRPLPGVQVQVRVGDRQAPAHTLGEVWLKSPSLMAGYYPEGGGLTPDGWLATGDQGFLDADGYLHLRGRLKDIIVSGGTNLSAREIEEALLLDERVAEAAVMGVPHAIYGEVPRAYVRLRAPASSAQLLAHLSGLLSRGKLPHEIVAVESFPTTALGKIDKQKLKESPCEALP